MSETPIKDATAKPDYVQVTFRLEKGLHDLIDVKRWELHKTKPEILVHLIEQGAEKIGLKSVGK